MQKQFVTYPIALKLRELGFDEECLASYFVFGDGTARDGKYGQTEPELFIDSKKYLSIEEKSEELNMYAYHVVKVPLYQEVIDWFRDVYKIHISIIPFNDEEGEQILYEFVIHESDWNDTSDYTYYHSYQEAREEAILKCIRLCQMEK